MRQRGARALLAALAGAVLLGALLAWVGLPGRPVPASPPTITLALWAALPSEVTALDHAIANFTRDTGIVVKKEVIADKYMDVLRSRFAARNTPDVFYLDSAEAPFLIRSGVLLPLDGAVQAPEDFYPQFLDAFRGEDGRLYGIPKDYSTLALYINTELLARAGYRPEDVPADHDALLAFARRLQERLPRGVAAMIYEKDLARHLAALECLGPPVIDGRGDARLAGHAALHRYLQAYVDGRAAGALFSPRDDLGSDSPGAAFGAGRAVLMLEGNWVQANLRQDYPDVRFATREMPRVAGRANTMAFVVGYAVSRFGRNREGGIRFAQYMTTVGMQDWSRLSGTLPSRRSVQRAMAPLQDARLAPHIAGAAYATVWSRGTSLPIVDTNFGNQFLAALNGSKPVAEAMARAEALSNREIERQR